MTAAQQLIAIIDKAAAANGTMELTSQQRINAASAICNTIMSFGPSWVEFAAHGAVGNETTRTLSREQFADFLDAKRAFATRNA